ncbi:hypothetical protein QMK19_24800 [Streptomyces sp. H10-C2]|nr:MULTISPECIES: hypothetical protein [unclassified Streptomyces]MDJ0343031.1 hypothetical protein [Streptomyces sp. PH10-H1]MDJ0372789.1 hypothetical protein [Streptomyces sp. H10-C2]
MDWANLAVALASMITGVVVAYFAYVPLRDQIRRPEWWPDSSTRP